MPQPLIFCPAARQAGQSRNITTLPACQPQGGRACNVRPRSNDFPLTVSTSLKQVLALSPLRDATGLPTLTLRSRLMCGSKPQLGFVCFRLIRLFFIAYNGRSEKQPKADCFSSCFKLLRSYIARRLLAPTSIDFTLR